MTNLPKFPDLSLKSKDQHPTGYIPDIYSRYKTQPQSKNTKSIKYQHPRVKLVLITLKFYVFASAMANLRSSTVIYFTSKPTGSPGGAPIINGIYYFGTMTNLSYCNRIWTLTVQCRFL